jgi:hypothetical protein
MTENIPPGFARHFRKSPVTDPWEPLYSRRDGDIFCLGLRIAKSHCNARGMLHGGVISALADNALGISCLRPYRAGLGYAPGFSQYLRCPISSHHFCFEAALTKPEKLPLLLLLHREICAAHNVPGSELSGASQDILASRCKIS